MKELKSKQRAYLMKLASSLDPIFSDREIQPYAGRDGCHFGSLQYP